MVIHGLGPHFGSRMGIAPPPTIGPFGARPEARRRQRTQQGAMVLERMQGASGGVVGGGPCGRFVLGDHNGCLPHTIMEVDNPHLGRGNVLQEAIVHFQLLEGG